jgi:hypothetical protein
MDGPWGLPPAYEPPSAVARAALVEVYRKVDEALAPVASACRACGKCCRFEPGGIILFASALELACLVAETAAASAITQRKPSRGGSPDPPRERCGYGCGNDACAAGPETRRAELRESWHCPYQRENLCTARGARLLGCRTYFCDAAARAAGERIYADALREIQRIAAGQGPWWYGPARLYFEHV